MIQALKQWFKKIFSPQAPAQTPAPELTATKTLAVQAEPSALAHTLEQFFQSAPWENRAPEPEPEEVTVSANAVLENPNAVLGQAMGSFFTQVQWQSSRAEQNVPPHIASQILHQDMQHFFQGSNWQGGATLQRSAPPGAEDPVTVPPEAVASDATEDFFDDINW